MVALVPCILRLAIAIGLPHGGETWYTDAHGEEPMAL
jgi:hypothetical protein